MARFDELPQEILQRIAYEIGSYRKTDLRSLALTCRSTLDCARQVLVYNLDWDHWIKPAAKFFFSTHPQYFSAIGRFDIVAHSLPRAECVEILTQASAVHTLYLEARSFEAVQQLGEAAAALGSDLRLRKLIILDCNVVMDQKQAEAFWKGVVQVVTCTSNSLRDLTVMAARDSSPPRELDPFPTLPRLDKVDTDAWPREALRSCLTSCPDGVLWETGDDHLSVDAAALDHVTGLSVFKVGPRLSTATIATFRRLETIDGWRVEGNVELSLLSSRLQDLDIWLNDLDQLRDLLQQLKHSRAAPDALKDIYVQVQIDAHTEAREQHDFEDWEDLVAEAEEVCTAQDCQLTVEWMTDRYRGD